MSGWQFLSHFWLIYIGEKGKTLSKRSGIKWGAIGNILWGHIENLENPNGNLRTSLGTPHSPLQSYSILQRRKVLKMTRCVECGHRIYRHSKLDHQWGWMVCGLEIIFHWISDQWLTALITYVSTIQNTSTYVVATKCFT
jgi:ferredoxin-like protein FixX